jgi:hypothetical protein
MNTNRTAENAYASAYAEALRHLAAIQELIEDMPAPSEQTNWGHVGDMNHVVGLLRAIRATMGEEES